MNAAQNTLCCVVSTVYTFFIVNVYVKFEFTELHVYYMCYSKYEFLVNMYNGR